MSVGIAAICDRDQDGAGRIVGCMDRKISTDSASAETETKCNYIQEYDLAAIFAGDIACARELMQMYADYFKTSPLDWNNVLEQLRTPPRLLKQRRAEAYTQSRLAISYERFLKDGKNELDPGIYQRMTHDIYGMTTEVRLIIFGFEGTDPRLFKFAHDEVWEEKQFACIGAGEEAASHSLFRRKQEPGMPVAKSLYNVWEAKKFSELSPTVGTATVAFVCDPASLSQNHLRYVGTEGEKFLNAKYKHYGPRPIPPDFALPDGSLLSA